MTNSRKELIHLIEQLSDADPELRMGQIITNLATLARGPQVESVWDCEDDELVAAAHRLLNRIAERRAVVA